MAGRFKVGDHVSWNSEAGRVSGTIIAVHVRDFDYKGHTHRTAPPRTIPNTRSGATGPIMSPPTREPCCGASG